MDGKAGSVDHRTGLAVVNPRVTAVVHARGVVPVVDPRIAALYYDAKAVVSV
jgi:hypothetical protein